MQIIAVCNRVLVQTELVISGVQCRLDYVTTPTKNITVR